MAWYDFLVTVGSEISNSFLDLAQGIGRTIPGLVGAIIILTVGYLLGVLAGWLVNLVCEKIELDKYLVSRTNLKRVLGNFQLSYFLSLISKWYVFVLFFIPAAGLIAPNLKGISNFLEYAATIWVPNLIIAVVLAILGLLAADYVALKVRETKAKSAGLIADTAKVVILIFTVLIVLEQIGVAITVAEQSIIILLAGAMLAIALMLGLGFGLALKDEAKGIIKDIKKKL